MALYGQVVQSSGKAFLSVVHPQLALVSRPHRVGRCEVNLYPDGTVGVTKHDTDFVGQSQHRCVVYPVTAVAA